MKDLGEGVPTHLRFFSDKICLHQTLPLLALFNALTCVQGSQIGTVEVFESLPAFLSTLHIK